MKPEEMPVELLTEPITHFGLYADMLPFSVIPESEWIIVDMSIQRPTIVQSYFRSQRRCGGSPTEEITLYRYLLRRTGTGWCVPLSSYLANFLLNLKMRDISSGFDISLLVKIPLFL